MPLFMPEPIHILLLALLLDMLLGDPETDFHPVRIMGYVIAWLKKWLIRAPFPGDIARGVVLLMVPSTIFGLFVWYVVHITMYSNRFIGEVVASVLLYFSIGMRSLGDEAMSVYEALVRMDCDTARQRLSRIVGRDTSVLNEAGITRATIETVAENFVDAVFAPMFYWALLGTWGAVVYRVVNTLDAMVGYKTKDLKDIGCASARMDDLLNFIPSRLSPVPVFLSMLFFKMNSSKPWSLFKYWKRCLMEGMGHESPNSAISEAAFALALGASLGGPVRYQDGMKKRPFLNKDARAPVFQDIVSAVKLLYSSVLMAAILVWAIFQLKELF